MNLDWCSIYAILESIILRNLLCNQYGDIVQQIYDTQNLLNQTDATDSVFIEQLTRQLIAFKTQLYQKCHNLDCNTTMQPIRLFPKKTCTVPITKHTTKSMTPPDRRTKMNAVRQRLKMLRQNYTV